MHVGTPRGVKKAAWITAGVGLAVIVLSFLVVFLARSIGGATAADGIGLTGRALLLGAVLLGLNFVPKLPGRGFLGGIGVLFLLLGLIGGLFFGNGKRKERGQTETEGQVVRVEQPAMPAPSMEEVREIVRIPLLGEDNLSDVALRSGMIPPKWYYYFEGPYSARIHFEDGTSGSITELFGMRNGAGRFSGPAGGVVVVRAYPPSK